MSVEMSSSAEPSAAAKARGRESDEAEAESARSLSELIVGSFSSRWARQLVQRAVCAAASAPAPGRKSGLLFGVMRWALRSLFRKRTHDEADAGADAECSNAAAGQRGRDSDAERAAGSPHTKTSTGKPIEREQQQQQPRFDLFVNAASSSTFDLHAILGFAMQHTEIHTVSSFLVVHFFLGIYYSITSRICVSTK